MNDIEKILATGWSRDDDGTFVAAIGKVFIRCVDAGTEVALQTGKIHRNLSGQVHGGVIVTLLDRVMGINVRNAIGERATTATITVNFLKPVRTGDFLRATCRLTKVGRTLIFAEGQAYVDDRLVATGVSVCCRRPSRTNN